MWSALWNFLTTHPYILIVLFGGLASFVKVLNKAAETRRRTMREDATRKRIEAEYLRTGRIEDPALTGAHPNSLDARRSPPVDRESMTPVNDAEAARRRLRDMLMERQRQAGQAQEQREPSAREPVVLSIPGTPPAPMTRPGPRRPQANKPSTQRPGQSESASGGQRMSGPKRASKTQRKLDRARHAEQAAAEAAAAEQRRAAKIAAEKTDELARAAAARQRQSRDLASIDPVQFRGLKPAEIRRALVLAEVLAAPVSLREHRT